MVRIIGLFIAISALSCGRGTLDLTGGLSASTDQGPDSSIGPTPRASSNVGAPVDGGGQAPSSSTADDGRDGPEGSGPSSSDESPQVFTPVADFPVLGADAGQFCSGGMTCPADRPFCHERGYCVECFTDGWCDGREICRAGECVHGCRVDRDCDRDQQCEVLTNRCVGCTTGRHCELTYNGERSLCINFECRPCDVETPCPGNAECIGGRCEYPDFTGSDFADDPSVPPDPGPEAFDPNDDVFGPPPPPETIADDAGVNPVLDAATFEPSPASTPDPTTTTSPPVEPSPNAPEAGAGSR
jgi:hypothetical protein